MCAYWRFIIEGSGLPHSAFSFSVSNSPCQHLPSVPTQLGSIQLSCPESERGKVKQGVCVLKRERYNLFITNSFYSFSHFLLCRSNVLQLLWVFVSHEEAFVFSDVPNLSSWCCAGYNLKNCGCTVLQMWLSRYKLHFFILRRTFC